MREQDEPKLPPDQAVRLRRWLRVTGLTEGVSYLLLLGVAMPLKYAAEVPEAVTVVGWIHGLLFMMYVLAAFLAWRLGAITLKTAVACGVAAVLPAGPFFIDGRLREPDDTAAAPVSSEASG